MGLYQVLTVCFGDVISYDVVLFGWVQIFELCAVILMSWNPEPFYGYGEAFDFGAYVMKEVVIWLTRIEGMFLLDGVNGRLAVKSNSNGSCTYVAFFTGCFDDEEAARYSSKFAAVCALSVARARNGVDREYARFGASEDRAGGAVAGFE